MRVMRAERPPGSNVRIHPVIGEGREVSASRVAIEAIAADAGPRGVRVLLAIWRRWHGDVVQMRKLPPYPRTRIVLIGNRVHAQLRHEQVERGRITGGPDVGERLRERVRATPDADPQRPRILTIDGADDEVGAG